jgi:predicted metallopeptidase
MKKAMKAHEIARTAADLVGGERDRQHGQKKDNFRRIAALWQAYLTIRRDPKSPLDAVDVGHMMVLMKIARTQSGGLNPDDYIDACGYAACAGEIACQDAVDQSWADAANEVA